MIENFQQKLLLATKQKLIQEQKTEMSLTDILSVLNEPDLLTLLTQDFSDTIQQSKISFDKELIQFNALLTQSFKSNFLTPSYTEKDFIHALIFKPETYLLLNNQGEMVNFKFFLINYVNNLNEKERNQLFTSIIYEEIDSPLIPYIFIPTKKELFLLFSYVNSLVNITMKQDNHSTVEYLTKLTKNFPLNLSDLSLLTTEDIQQDIITILPVQFNKTELVDFLNNNNENIFFNQIVEKASLNSLNWIKDSFHSLTEQTKQQVLSYLIDTKKDIFTVLRVEIIEAFTLFDETIQQQFLNQLNRDKNYVLLDTFIKPEQVDLLDNGFYKTLKQAELSLQSDKEQLVALFEKDMLSLSFLYDSQIISIETLFDKLPVNENTANLIAMIINDKITANEPVIDYFRTAYQRGFLFSDVKHLAYLTDKKQIATFKSIEDKQLLLSLLTYHFEQSTSKQVKETLSLLLIQVAFDLGKQQGDFSAFNTLLTTYQDTQYPFFNTVLLDINKMNVLNTQNKQVLKERTLEYLKKNKNKDNELFFKNYYILDLFSTQELMSFIDNKEYEPYIQLLLAKSDDKRQTILSIFFDKLDIDFYKQYGKKNMFMLEERAFFEYSQQHSLTQEQLYAFLSCYELDKELLANMINHNPALIALLELKELTYLISLKQDISPELLSIIPLEQRKELFLSLLKHDNAQYLFDLLSININQFTNKDKMDLFLTIFNLKDETLFLFLKENGITVNFDELTANEKVILLAESQEYFNYFVDTLEKRFKEKTGNGLSLGFNELKNSDKQKEKNSDKQKEICLLDSSYIKDVVDIVDIIDNKKEKKKGLGFFFKSFFSFRKTKTELVVSETKTLLLSPDNELKEKEPLKYFLKVRTVPVKTVGAMADFKENMEITAYFRPLLSDRITNRLDSIENHIVYLLNDDNQHFLDDGEKFFLLDSAKNLTFNVLRNYLASPLMLSTFGIEQQQTGDKLYCEQLDLIESGLSTIMKNQQKRAKDNMLSETAVLKALSDNFLREKGENFVIKN